VADMVHEDGVRDRGLEDPRQSQDEAEALPEKDAPLGVALNVAAMEQKPRVPHHSGDFERRVAANDVLGAAADVAAGGDLYVLRASRPELIGWVAPLERELS
jgi:hypothetical protein